MAANNQEFDYTTIDRPYDGSLSRVTDESTKLGSPSLLEGSADTSGNGASISTNNKITSSGAELTDIWLNTWIKSKNYLPKARGFFIDAMAGYIECMNVFISGDITATTGSIGGFVVGPDYLRDLANSFGLASTVTSADDVRFWAGSTFANRSSAPFRITEAGVLTAQSGTVGGWTMSSTTLTSTGIVLDAGNQKITVGSATPSIIIDGVNKNVRTSTYATGTAGWSITKDGDAEFNNLVARGEFHTQVLSYGSVHVTAGSNLLALSGGTLKDTIVSMDNNAFVALETSLTDLLLLETGDDMILESNIAINIKDPPTGHVQVFSVGDVLRIKDGSGDDNWFTVVSASDKTTYYEYTCTKSSGSNATFYAGAAVADYGQTGQGLIFSTVDSTNSPYISVQTHAGSPWSALTERVRMGNLNGFLDYATNIYGFAVGSSASTNANIAIDPTNGIRIRNGTTNVITLDNSGNVTVNTITAVSGTIAAFTIASNTISATNLTLTSGAANTANITVGTGSTAGGLNSANTGTDIAIWAGSTFASRASAAFRVNAQGDLVATSATITGSITASSGTIGGFTVGASTITATNLVLTSGAANTANITVGTGSTAGGLNSANASGDIVFWAGSTFASRATAAFRVTAAGAITATSATITGALTTSAGSSLDGTYLTAASVASSKSNLALRGWTQTSAFTVASATQVNWGAGTFTASDGTSYSIGASNTGAMAAKTYIYLDIATSTTAYQITTTATTAVGDGKVLIAVAQNNTNEATFQLFGGNGGLNIDASNIVTGSITANEIAASTITAGKMNVSTLSAITADLGAITAGTVTLNTSGYVRGGQTDYNTGTGFFLGYSGAAYKLSIGDSTTSNSLTWDGSLLSVNGSTVSGNDIFGSGADGAFALDGTNTYAMYMSKSGNDYTLLMDVFSTTFTMSGSATLTTNGYRLFCKTSLTTGASNVIKWTGNNGGNGGAASTGTRGSAGSAGTVLTSANLWGGVAGAAGGQGGSDAVPDQFVGANGGNVTNSYALSAHAVTSGLGGHGGNNGLGTPPFFTGTTASGSVGSITSSSSVRPYSAAFGVRMYDELPGASLAYLRYQSGVPGAGGGTGGRVGCLGATGGAGGGGGGSGSSGGTIVICARTISHAGSITSTGGVGGNGGKGGDALGGAFCGGGGAGGGGGGGGGGGSGGGGGQVMLIYSSLSGAGTITAVGGAGGSAGTFGAGGIGTGGGADGQPGVAGTAGSTGPAGVVIQLIV